MIEHGPSGAGTGPETVYAFDAMGNLQSLTDDTGNTTTWTYDLLGWKATETNSDTTPDTRSFYYNNGGMMTRMVNANGQSMCWNYDKLGRVTKHYWRSNPTTDVRSIQYTFDRLGRLVTVTDTDNVPNPDVVLGTWTFDPDDLDRNETATIALHGRCFRHFLTARDAREEHWRASGT